MRYFCLLPFACFISLCSATEQFGDITVAPQSMHSGQTYHGYAETRVLLENHSSATTHRVTLVIPNRAWRASGNGLESISRTVMLAPGARVLVPLWQPPLPASGDNQMRELGESGLARGARAL